MQNFYLHVSDTKQTGIKKNFIMVFQAKSKDEAVQEFIRKYGNTLYLTSIHSIVNF